MFSRLYKRNFDAGQGSGKNNRIRITLQDRAGSKEFTDSPSLKKESSPIIQNEEEPQTRRSNTIGRIIHNGSQQVYYPVNPNNTFIRQPIRGRYNSNIIQSSHSNIQLRDFSEAGFGRQGSNSSNSSSSMKSLERISQNSVSDSKPRELSITEYRIRSMVSSEGFASLRNKKNEIEDSENERLNSNREKPSPPIGTYVLPERPVGICEASTELKRNSFVVSSISLKKEKLPVLEILSEEKRKTLCKSATRGSDSSRVQGEKETLKLSDMTIESTRNVCELISKFKSKSAFSFVRLNLLLHFAAIVIQCYFRRYLCKKYFHFAKLGPIKLLNSSAVQIQACWRSFLVRFGVSPGRDSRLKIDRCRLVIGRNWSFLHEKCTFEIERRRSTQAIRIQRFWRDVYIYRISLERSILANTIFSARAIARGTIEKCLQGFIVRRRVDSKYKLIPIKWTWNVQDISSIYVLLKISNKWSEPKKMWFNEEEKVFKYNLFLSSGVHQIVFKAYFNTNSSGEVFVENGGNFKILCDSSLETIPNEKYQFANCIRVPINGNCISAFKHFRETIMTVTPFSESNSIEDFFNSEEIQIIKEDLNYASLSPSYKRSLDEEYSDLDHFNSPSKYLNEVISTPSTNIDLSPQVPFPIH
ncbi:IQ calmodulin-binding motif family protein [Cryptosporidium felis]|nr:IQ calmodulin-binding motif family protein [Cryptosporidium felis]